MPKTDKILMRDQALNPFGQVRFVTTMTKDKTIAAIKVLTNTNCIGEMPSTAILMKRKPTPQETPASKKNAETLRFDIILDRRIEKYLLLHHRSKGLYR